MTHHRILVIEDARDLPQLMRLELITRQLCPTWRTKRSNEDATAAMHGTENFPPTWQSTNAESLVAKPNRD